MSHHQWHGGDLLGLNPAELPVTDVGDSTVLTTTQVFCSAAGTRLATPSGERAVQTLRAG